MKIVKKLDDEPRVYEFAAFRLDVGARQLLRSGEGVHLTPRIFDTLVYLVEHRGRVLSKDELLTALWPDVAVEENNLGQAISKLRQTLGEAPGENRFIATVPGHGYRFVAEVIPVPASAGPAIVAGTRRPRWRQSRMSIVGMAVGAAVAAGALLWTFQREPAGPGPTRTIAVLPFKPLVAGAPDPALEFGVADSLIVKLGAFDALTVRPLAAVRRFEAPSIDPVSAGRDLGVDAVLDGHLHRTDDRIRVSVRLLRVSDGRQLWADQFDEPLAGIFAIQDAISSRVAEALAVELAGGEPYRLARRSTSSPAAYEAYLRGRFFISLAQPLQAIEMFERAIALDPGYAAAHAGLADILSRVPIATDAAAPAFMGRARTLAARALELDPDLAAAHAVLGWISFYEDWDWPASEAHYRRAQALDPADFSARLGLAHLLANTGRTAEALEQADRALEAIRCPPWRGR